MGFASYPEVAVGFLLVFFVPGYALTKATFPEWRIRGREAYRRLLETFSLAFVLSIVLTVVVGYALLAAAPGGFQAYWTSPVLEAALAGVAAIAFAVGWFRGAYRAEPPPAPSPDAGEERDPWAISRELERIGREERRLAHELRTHANDPAESQRIRERVSRLQEERAELQRSREAEYAT